MVTGRLFAEGCLAPSADQARRVRFGSKRLCVFLWVCFTLLRSLVPFGPSVRPQRPPQNSPLTCFDQWSKRYRMDLTPPKPVQTLGNALTLKMRGLKWHFRPRAPARHPFACGADCVLWGGFLLRHGRFTHYSPSARALFPSCQGRCRRHRRCFRR